ncbi:GntR family transcriptional regulator [Streptomyces sp. bgisy091]|uniref:GntR family transcriptional regulator n=1 Tax=Streptomyces sp. bgisy091 TaxID=3413778 RepID=UPI003D73201F
MSPRSLPVYRRIAEVLRQDVLDGRLREGSLLPSEREVCRRFRVARATARHSLHVLVREDLAVPVQGVGYVVAGTRTPTGAAPGTRSVRVPVAFLNTAIEMLEANAVPATASRVATLLRAAVHAG